MNVTDKKDPMAESIKSMSVSVSSVERITSSAIWKVLVSVFGLAGWIMCEATCAVCVQLLQGAVPDWELNFVRYGSFALACSVLHLTFTVNPQQSVIGQYVRVYEYSY